MSEILVTLPDGSKKSLPMHSTAEDVAGTIGKGLQKAGIAARFNGELVDYRRPLTEDGTIDIITKDSDEALEILRHSAAHIMAQAIKRLHPDVHFGVGPAIENGFYYDTDMEEQLQEEELPKIEKEMMEIVKANYPFLNLLHTAHFACQLRFCLLDHFSYHLTTHSTALPRCQVAPVSLVGLYSQFVGYFIFKLIKGLFSSLY